MTLMEELEAFANQYGGIPKREILEILSRHKKDEGLKDGLLPCPFCGKYPQKTFCEEDCCGAKLRMIDCECGASVWGDEKSIEMWNTRKGEVK